MRETYHNVSAYEPTATGKEAICPKISKDQSLRRRSTMLSGAGARRTSALWDQQEADF